MSSNAGMDGYSTEPESSDSTRQKVYRCISTDGSGWRVWEMLQVIGEHTPGTLGGYGVEDRDGNWWYVSCGHYWTKEHMESVLSNNDFDRWQEVELIKPPVKGAWVFKGYNTMTNARVIETFVHEDKTESYQWAQRMESWHYCITTQPYFDPEETWINPSDLNPI